MIFDPQATPDRIKQNSSTVCPSRKISLPWSTDRTTYSRACTALRSASSMRLTASICRISRSEGIEVGPCDRDLGASRILAFAPVEIVVAVGIAQHDTVAFATRFGEGIGRGPVIER